MTTSSQPSYYFDHAATTPLDHAVLASMTPYLKDQFANPSSLYRSARASRAAVEEARRTLAQALGAKPTEVVFTSGSTEGNNMAIQGVLRRHPGAHWVTSAIEHDSVLGITGPYQTFGHSATVVPVKPDGIVDVAIITAAITDATVLVSLMLANNEIGTIQPVAEVARAVAAIRADRVSRGIQLPLFVHTDATQAAGYLDLHVTRMGIDLLTLNGSKIYGPKGIGMLYVRTGTQLEPLLYGGGQERGRRSGTEHVAGIVGLAKALQLAVEQRESEGRRLTVLRDHLMRALVTALPDVVVNGHLKHRLPNNLNLTIPGVEGEGLILYLDEAGIQASTGSACSTGNLDPSHVLLALGRTPDQANSSLRLTLGRSTDAAAVEQVIKVVPPTCARLRELVQY